MNPNKTASRTNCRKPQGFRQAFYILCAAMIFFVKNASFAENLLVNGDFEATSNGKINGWISKNDQSGPSQEGNFIHGKTSLVIKGDDGKGSASLVKGITNIEPGKKYSLSFYAKSSNPGQVVTAYYYTPPKIAPHWYRKRAFVVSETWTKYVYPMKFPIEKEWQNRPLTIMFQIPKGEVYLDDVVLDRDDSAEAGTISGRIEIQPRKNLIANSGFELGWSGWGIGTQRNAGVPYEEPEQASAIDFKEKYEGTASIRLEPNTNLMSIRYPIVSGENYTLTFYMKGKPGPIGTGRKVYCHVLTPTWNKNQVVLTVGQDMGSDWKRFTIPFNIKDQGSDFRNTVYFRVDSHENTVWLDAVQLEKGKPTDYDGGVEVGFLTQNELGLFSHGKEEVVDMAISSAKGIPENTIIGLEAKDIYNNILWTKKISLQPTSKSFFTVPIALENSSLGVIEVTAKIGRPGEDPLSANKWRYCVIDGTVESTKPNPLFGLENVVAASPRWTETLAEKVANAGGAQFTRVFIPGSEGDDSLMLSELRKDLLIKKASGKTVMICVAYPKDAKLRPHNPEPLEYSDAFVAAEVEKYAKYAAKIAAALTDSVDIYQILNEPNIWTSYDPKQKGKKIAPPSVYIKYLEAGSKAIRAAYPKARIAANTNGIHPDYAEDLFVRGASKYIDLFSFHSYRQTPENPPTFDSITKLRAVVDKYVKGMPIVNDEQYFGVRNMLMYSPEDLVDYCADTEEDQAGRILQNYLHHIAAGQVPFSLFSVQRTLYRQGMSNPVYYYEGFGGFRFMSQTLHDIVRAVNVDVHPSVRVFLFERKDGVKIVSLNTRLYGVKGGVRNSSASSAFDTNGNSLKTEDVLISYTPSYLIFPKATFDEVLAHVRKADYYGLDAAVRATFQAQTGQLTMTVENCTNKPIDTHISITKVPEGWPSIESFDLKDLQPRSLRKLNYTIPEKDFSWNKDYTIDYSASVGNTFISKSVRLPSMFASKSKINVDGSLEDWANTKVFTLDDNHLTPDYSEGKLPNKGVNDLSAGFSIAWDEDNLYVSVKVKDDVFFPGSGDKAFYFNDSVQIYFDMQNDLGKFYDDNDAVYSIGRDKNGKWVAFLDKNPTGRYVGDDNTEKGVDDDVKVAFKQTADGYVLEIAFAKAALPYMELKSGSEFGFSLLINDNDGAGRKQGLTFGPKGTEPVKKPALWRTIKLINAN